MIEPRKDAEGATTFYIGDVRVPRGFTPETDPAQITHFLALIQPHEAELLQMSNEYYAMIEKNIELNRTGGRGRDWPIFRRLLRYLDQFQCQAGIVNS